MPELEAHPPVKAMKIIAPIPQAHPVAIVGMRMSNSAFIFVLFHAILSAVARQRHAGKFHSA